MTGGEYMTFEIDQDGVLCDIYTVMEKKIRDEGYKNYSTENIRRYDMKNSGIGCPRVVLQRYLYKEDIYTEALPYEGAVEFVSWLLSNGQEVIIHTRSSLEQYNRKIKWLNDFQSMVTSGTFLVQIDTETELKNMLESADCTIEDSLGDLNRSPSDMRFLVNRHHNHKEYNMEYAPLFNEISCFDRLDDIKSFLKSVYKELR